MGERKGKRRGGKKGERKRERETKEKTARRKEKKADKGERRRGRGGKRARDREEKSELESDERRCLRVCNVEGERGTQLYAVAEEPHQDKAEEAYGEGVMQHDLQSHREEEEAQVAGVADHAVDAMTHQRVPGALIVLHQVREVPPGGDHPRLACQLTG